MISILISLLIFALVVYVISLIPLPPPFKRIAWAVISVILIIWLLEFIPRTPWRF